MAEPQVAYPNLGEKSGPMVWAHDHQPGIECFDAVLPGIAQVLVKRSCRPEQFPVQEATDFEDLNSIHSSRKW